MNPDPYRAKAIFLEAVEEQQPDQWPAFLDQACAGDPNLRRRVEELLQAHRQAGTSLPSPPSGEGPGVRAPVTVDEPAVSERPGTVIGRYKLLEQIGEGGFGVVFMAEQQEPVRRKVALKILKPGMDSRQVVARFEAERQALALMDHPNIAKVLDAGQTDTGRPYFVMDLVKGVPITDYCDQAQLTPRERLELFVPVCQAVQHAHQKGIIHRDLKPSNVMVTVQDGAPLVKVIDFGIAKALGQQLTDKTLFTAFAQLIGTPLYMSPEQVALSNVDVDTRSDIYSLGVLLYELLTGTTPFDKERLGKAAYDEMLRIIREEEPAKPSTRISTMGQAATPMAVHRRSDPRRLSQLCRNELDWIVMKALEKDRGLRYETASAFAADVQHYLADEPVAACPPSKLYQLRKFARRHKAGLAVGGAIVLVIVLAGVGLLAGALWPNAQLQVLLDETARAKDDAERQRDAAEIQRAFARRAVDEMYTQVAEKWLEDQPHMQETQKALLRKALQYYQEFARQLGSGDEADYEVAAAQARVGLIEYNLGNQGEATAAFDQAIPALDRMTTRDPLSVKYMRDLATSLVWRAASRVKAGSGGDLARGWRQVRSRLEKASRAFPAEPYFKLMLAKYTHILAFAGQTPDPVATYREAAALAEELVRQYPREGAYRGQAAMSLNNLGCLLAVTGRYEEAEAPSFGALELGEKLVADFPSVALYKFWLFQSYNDIYGLLLRTGRLKLADECKLKALHVAENLAAAFPDVPDYRGILADALLSRAYRQSNGGRAQQGLTTMRQAVAVVKELAVKHPTEPAWQEQLGRYQMLLADHETRAGHPRDAADTYERAFRTMGTLLAARPKDAGAVRLLSRSLSMCPLPQLRDPARAVKLAKKAVEQDPGNAEGRFTLALAQYRAGAWNQAAAALGRPPESINQGSVASAFLVAMTNWQLGEKAKARQWYDKGDRWMRTYNSGNGEHWELRAEAARRLGLPVPKE
jgi:serine/threonine protein kinase